MQDTVFIPNLQNCEIHNDNIIKNGENIYISNEIACVLSTDYV